MAYRFTNTDKWKDSWFYGLKPLEKLLFNYLCDNCDIAGFIEVITKNWASDIKETEAKIKGALKGVERGLVYSKEKDVVYIRTFLRHQKNLPLNQNNKSHLGILRKFDVYKYKFDIQDVDCFIQRGLEGASEGLGRGTGIGIGKDSKQEVGNKDSLVGKIKTWRDDYKIYLEECKTEFRKLSEDSQFISDMVGFYPGIDIKKSMGKSFTAFWGTEKGWIHKKKEKTTNIDWRATIINSLKFNEVKL